MITSRELETERFILSTMPVLYVPLWKRDGSSIMSDDAYGHLCTVSGATWTSLGRDFNGTTDRIALPDSASLKVEDGNLLTMILWLYLHTVQATVLIGANTTTTTQLTVALHPTGANFRLNKYGVEYAPASNNVPTNTWTQLGFSYNITSTVLIYYINGAAVKTTTWSQTFATKPKIIGCHILNSTIAQPLDGLLGDVLIYNCIASPLEIANNYEITKWRYQ